MQDPLQRSIIIVNEKGHVQSQSVGEVNKKLAQTSFKDQLVYKSIPDFLPSALFSL